MTERTIDPDAFNTFEAAAWEERAPTYEQFFGTITSRLAEPLLDAASVGEKTRVLDLATGPGYAAGEAARRGASVIAVDVAAAMVALARRLHPGLDVRQADALGQQEETQRRIREAFDRRVEEFRDAQGLELPVSVKLASGSEPS